MAYRYSPGSRTASGPWLVVFGTVAGVLGLSALALQPPRPLGRDAPADRFSEERARDFVRELTEGIGLRVNGTPGHRQAAEYLAAELRKLPGVEVEVQQVADIHTHRRLDLLPFIYHTTNVLGRLPGKSTDAILLDAHFDTLSDSVGAADDAAAVAAILEALRVLAAEAPLDRSIIVNLNGAEEIGLLGAAGFLKHPWAQQVRAYVYLEALPGGKAVLIGAGPGHPWLAKTYARTVAAPLGNVTAQELTQSGLLPFNGDFTPFHEAGLPGLDVAMVGDAFGVHTRLDRLARLEPGGLQHLGDATLAVTRALAGSEVQLVPTSEGAVYYDLLGFTMLAYSASTGCILGVLALVCFALLLVRARFFYWVTIKGVLAACGWSCLSVVAGVLAALLPAMFLKSVVHRSLGWFGHPALVIAAFALPASAGMLGVHHFWRARALRKMIGDENRLVLTAWMGAILFWALLLLLATVRGSGLGYVPLFWVAGGTAGVLLAGAVPRLRLAGMLLALLPGTVVTLENATLIIANLVPMVGLTPAEAPTDLVVPLLVGLLTCLVFVLACTLPYRDGGLGKVALVCAALGVAGLAATALTPPYSAARPKRLLAAHAADGAQAALLLAGCGPDGMRPLLPFLTDARPAPATWPSLGVFVPSFTHLLPASVPAMAAPNAEALASTYDAGTDTRKVTLHIHGGSPKQQLLVPAPALLAWSLGEKLPPSPPVDGKYQANLEGVPEAGVVVELTLRGWQPVEIDLRSIAPVPAASPEAQALAARLPDWVNLTAYSMRRTLVKL